MKVKQLIVLVFVFIALSAVVFVKKIQQPLLPAPPETAGLKLPHVRPEEVSEITVTVPDTAAGAEKKIVLAQDAPGQWRVPGQYQARAQAEKIEELLKNISSLEGDLRSDAAEILIDYGIDDPHAVAIAVQSKGKELVRVLIGTKRAGMDGNFVRRAGSNAVFLVEKNFLTDLGFWAEVSADIFTADPWIDKTVARFDPAKITAISLSSAGRPQINLQRIKEEETVSWKFVREYPAALDSNKAEQYLQALSGLQATELVSPDAATAAKNGDWLLTLTPEQGEPITVRRGPKDPAGTNYFLAVSDTEYGYAVSTWYVDELNKTDGDFFVDNPLSIDAAAVTELEVERAGSAELTVLTRQAAADGVAAVWRDAGGRDVPAEGVANFLQRLSQLRLVTLEDIPALAGVEVRLAFGVTEERRQIVVGEEFDCAMGKCHRLEIVGMQRPFAVRAAEMRFLLESAELLVPEASVPLAGGS
ncbi:MAG: DUF4340 domain-containing protein [Candidatus Omnitrophica bacterium]|nr:DUF4340 domain-containing protein [Candidatus Omnitrophota bacterium]